MPKASYSREEMFTPSNRGFVETIGSKKLGEVVACVSRFVQWQANKKTGAQVAPLTSVILSIAQIDAAGTRIAEPVEQELVVEWGPKDASMIRVRPGLADSRDGEAADTADNGVLVLGTEGNCLFVEEGTKVNMTNSFGAFVCSCQEKGFKPQILNAGYLTDFVGMRAWFDLKVGREYTGADGANKKVEDFVVQEITRFPYESAAQAKPASAKKTAATAKPAVPAPAKVSSAPSPAPAGDSDIEAICIDALKKVSDKIAATTSDALTRQKIMVLAIQQVLAPNSGVDKSKHQAIQAQLKDQEWFEENAISFGAVNSGDDKYMMVGSS